MTYFPYSCFLYPCLRFLPFPHFFFFFLFSSVTLLSDCFLGCSFSLSFPQFPLRSFMQCRDISFPPFLIFLFYSYLFCMYFRWQVMASPFPFLTQAIFHSSACDNIDFSSFKVESFCHLFFIELLPRSLSVLLPHTFCKPVTPVQARQIEFSEWTTQEVEWMEIPEKTMNIP